MTGLASAACPDSYKICNNNFYIINMGNDRKCFQEVLGILGEAVASLDGAGGVREFNGIQL